MKPFGNGVVILLSAAFLSVSPAQEAPAVKLTGMVNLENHKRACLEIKEGHSTRGPILQEGDRDGNCEVVSIDEKTGNVQVRIGNSNPGMLPGRAPGITVMPRAVVPGGPTAGKLLTLRFAGPADDVPNRTLQFQAAPSRQVLDIYQELSQRTVISLRNWPEFTLELKTAAGLSRDEVLAALEKAFAAHGIAFKNRSDKFVFVVPENKLPLVDAIKDPPAGPKVEQPVPIPRGPVDARAEIFPPGLIKFQEADLLQALDLYQELSGRSILRPTALPPIKVSVRSQTQQTRGEAIWMLESLFALSDIAMVNEGEKFVFAVLTKQTNNLPKFDAAKVAASFKDPSNAKEIVWGGIKFQDVPVWDVLQIYADLLGRKPVMDTQHFPCRLTLRGQTVITRAEAIFAIEAVAALNGIGFEVLPDETVRLVQVKRTPNSQ